MSMRREDDDDLCRCSVKAGPHWETEQCRAQQEALERMRTRGLPIPRAPKGVR